MKIVCIDNFDRDYIPDSLVCENVNKYYGELLTNFLNQRLAHVTSDCFYRLEADDYKLKEFVP